MPPAKSRVAQEDPGVTTKEKFTATTQNSAARGRRIGQSNLLNGSSLKEVMNSTADFPSITTSNGAQSSTSNGLSATSWAKDDLTLLQTYRSVYRLETPSSFKNPLAHILLTQGIGRHSPTMAREKAKRRVNKDGLALAVRKNFNALAVNEQEVIVDFLYKVKMKDKDLRARFAPIRK